MNDKNAKHIQYYYDNKEKVLERQKAYKKMRYANDDEFRARANKHSKLDYYARCINSLLVSLELKEKQLEDVLKEPIEINGNYYRIKQYRANIKELEGKIEGKMSAFHMLNLQKQCISVIDNNSQLTITTN